MKSWKSFIFAIGLLSGVGYIGCEVSMGSTQADLANRKSNEEMTMALQSKKSSVSEKAPLVKKTSTKSVEDFKIEVHEIKTELPNTIWFIPSDRPIVSVSIVFRNAGKKNINLTHPALGSFFAEMLSKGAGPYDNYEFMGKAVDCGASFNCVLGLDDAACSLWVPADRYQEAFDLAILPLLDPKLPKKFMEKIRSEKWVDFEENLKDPNVLLGEAANQKLFSADHPYRQDLEAIRADLKKVSIKDIQRHLKFFAQENAIIVVLGPRDQEQAIVAGLEKMIQKLPKKSETTRPVTEKINYIAKDVHIPFDIPQTMIVGVMPGFCMDDPQLFAKNLAFRILAGGGMTSRFFTEIRKNRGLAYAAYGSVIHGDLADWIRFDIGTRSETADEAIKVAREVVSKVQKEGFTKKEFDLAKKEILGSLVVGLDASGKFIAYVADARNSGFSIQKIQETMAQYKALTLQDLNQACRTLLDPSRLAFITIGNHPEKSTKKEIAK